VRAARTRLHLHRLLEYLTADCRQPAGPRQAIDESHLQRRFKGSKTTADRGMIHLQRTGGARQGTDPAYGQKIPDVFPIGHLCDFSTHTRTYTEFSHR
jgi:hypothetical protein